MKIVLINDQHWGFKNDSPVFVAYFTRFYNEILFPYLKQNKESLDAIVSLGDLFDRRKYINVQTYYHAKWMIESLAKFDKPLYIIPGNHDVMYRNTNKVTSLSFIEKLPNVVVVGKPFEIDMGSKRGLFVPWINEENKSRYLDAIKSSKANILFGHLEINGFSVVHGIDCSFGLDESLFTKFTRVFSGHFHTRQQKGNIVYLGSQYQMNFGEEHDIKGFHVYDTETNVLEFIENPIRFFYTINYDESKDFLSHLSTDRKNYEKAYIKIITSDTDNPIFFESFLDEVYKMNPSQVMILQKSEYELSKLTDKSLNTTTTDVDIDTITLIEQEVDKIQNLDNPEKLKEIFGSLYQAALLVEDGDSVV